MDDIDGNVIDVDVRFQGESCLAEAEVLECGEKTTTTSTKQFSANVCDHCPGIVFSRYGCIPRFLETGGGSFVVETRLDGVDTLSALVDDVRQCCDRVVVRSITSTNDSDGVDSCSVDISTLTPKQREAVSKAQDSGHYDPDRQGSLAELSEGMEISTSALSQRLQRAEANIMRQLDCDCSCWMDS